MFRELSDEIEGLMTGAPSRSSDPAYPPIDSGILGPDPPPDDLSIVVSVGASLFDGRYGLADRRPRELVEMPFIANDRLDPERSHGDLLLTIQAEHSDTVLFALRQLMRRTRRTLVLQVGGGGLQPALVARRPHHRLAAQPARLRRRHGQPAAHEAELLDRHVWTPAAAASRRGPPAAATT